MRESVYNGSIVYIDGWWDSQSQLSYLSDLRSQALKGIKTKLRGLVKPNKYRLNFDFFR
jgi:hypothetical protein